MPAVIRTAVALFAAVALLATTAAAPIPKARRTSAEFFPTQVGTKWVYDGVFDEVSEEVVESEVSGGEVRWTARRTTSLSTEERSYVATRDGVTERTSRGERCLLRFPLVEGETWQVEPLAQATTGGWAEVHTPGGVFKAVAVSTPGTTRWYAPGVGVVMVENAGGRKQVLKSFTPGKADTK
jgi:hypothetical protein